MDDAAALQAVLLTFVIGFIALFVTWQLNGFALLLFHGHSGLGYVAPVVFGSVVAILCHVWQVWR